MTTSEFREFRQRFVAEIGTKWRLKYNNHKKEYLRYNDDEPFSRDNPCEILGWILAKSKIDLSDKQIYSLWKVVSCFKLKNELDNYENPFGILMFSDAINEVLRVKSQVYSNQKQPAITIPTIKGITHIRTPSDLKNLCGKVLRFEFVYSNVTSAEYYFATIVSAYYLEGRDRVRFNRVHFNVSPIVRKRYNIDGLFFNIAENDWGIHLTNTQDDDISEWGTRAAHGRAWLML